MMQENFKKMLLDKQTELTNRLKQLKQDSSREDNPVSADFEEQAVEREGEDVMEEVGRLTQVELEEIKVALKRIDLGTYGICAECGDEILAARLEAIPMALYCTDCQEYVDQVNSK